MSEENFGHIERLTKFLLWSRGGHRVYFSGPALIGGQLQAHYADTPTGRFDAELMGRIYERPFEVVVTTESSIPPPKQKTASLGRHLDGCRIGFDLGASDRKAAAVIDGKVVFSEEKIWNPVSQSDPQWHFDEIMDSLKQAAKHMPRVDAIGGSAAGVYVGNRVRAASLFRGVPKDQFDAKVRNMFIEMQKAWNNVPFEVVNDGEVTALAGAMSLNDNLVLGTALGSSQAGGYVDSAGRITSWLNEFAFVPIDYNPAAPIDEWSKDYGCGAQYLSQQCVARLLAPAGIEVDQALPPAEKLKVVQKLMEQGDKRAAAIYHTIGIYLGYAVAHYAHFYEMKHVLVLGRVMSGHGGTIILEEAGDVLKLEFPDIAARIGFVVPDERQKRHGQAIAAASLPATGLKG